MSEPRKIKAKLADMTADGSIIIHGSEGEHLIVELGTAQIRGFGNSVIKYAPYYNHEVEEPCA